MNDEHADPDVPARYPSSVLVVDDDPSVRTLLTMILEAEGFEVRCAGSAERALEMIDQGRPDVLIADVMMPGTDGRTLTRMLRSDSAFRDLPIVVCSALADDDAQWQAWAAGANSFVAKPFEPDRLVAELAGVYRNAVDARR